MTVLVTGGAGYIGGHVVLALLEAGYPAVVIDNLSAGSAEAVPRNVPLVVGDTGDVDLVMRTIEDNDVQTVIHLAGRISPEESLRDPLGYYVSNTIKSCQLLQSSIQAGVKHFVFSSTAAVYGNPGRLPIGEEGTLAPLSPYGASKAMAEQMVRDASDAHGLRFAILRYFNVAGADPAGRHGQHGAASHLIGVAIDVALGRRGWVDVYGDDYPTPDGTCIRDYIHVSDLAQAHLAVIEHLRTGGLSLTLNCGYGRGYSVKEVIKMVSRVAKRPIEVRPAPRRAGDSEMTVARCERLKQLGWTPRFADLALIIEHAYRWECGMRRADKTSATFGSSQGMGLHA